MQKKSEEKIMTIDFNGEQLILKTGKLAPRAESTAWVQLGGTVVFAVVSMNDEDTTLDYFPLTVEYIEKYYDGIKLEIAKEVFERKWALSIF